MKFYGKKDSNQVFLNMGVSAEYIGDELNLLTPNTTDAASEKHVPVVTEEDGQIVVRVGSAPHPMLDAHFIEWIFIKTLAGGIYRDLSPNDPPEATFSLPANEVLEVYAYCNLHGLWKADTSTLPSNAFDINETACSAEFPEGCIEPGAE